MLQTMVRKREVERNNNKSQLSSALNRLQQMSCIPMSHKIIHYTVETNTEEVMRAGKPMFPSSWRLKYSCSHSRRQSDPSIIQLHLWAVTAKRQEREKHTKEKNPHTICTFPNNLQVNSLSQQKPLPPGNTFVMKGCTWSATLGGTCQSYMTGQTKGFPAENCPPPVFLSSHSACWCHHFPG